MPCVHGKRATQFLSEAEALEEAKKRSVIQKISKVYLDPTCLNIPLARYKNGTKIG